MMKAIPEVRRQTQPTTIAATAPTASPAARCA